jgi:tyrosyl-tRNA synthetase
MTTDERYKLITRNLAEVLTEEDLKHLLETDTPLKHYIGFEISGRLHIGHFFQLMKVKDLQDAGADVTLWLADLHSVVNDKLGGDLDIIKKVGRDYFIPAMRILFESIGGNGEKLNFKFCSEEYAAHPEFWFTFLEMAKGTSLARSKRSITIMGREEAEDNIETAKIMYPIMQAADIFLLQTNIAQAGMDQRKVHVVARDSAMQIKNQSTKRLGRQSNQTRRHPYSYLTRPKLYSNRNI